MSAFGDDRSARRHRVSHRRCPALSLSASLLVSFSSHLPLCFSASLSPRASSRCSRLLASQPAPECCAAHDLSPPPRAMRRPHHRSIARSDPSPPRSPRSQRQQPHLPVVRGRSTLDVSASPPLSALRRSGPHQAQARRRRPRRISHRSLVDHRWIPSAARSLNRRALDRRHSRCKR